MAAEQMNATPPDPELWLGIDRELHDLCQPLTALQCRLELGQMIGDHEALLESVNGALVETERMFTAIAHMRERLAKEKEAEDVDGSSGK